MTTIPTLTISHQISPFRDNHSSIYFHQKDFPRRNLLRHPSSNWNMVLLAFRLCSLLAVAAAFFAGGSSLFASAVDLTAYSCEDLASLPTGNLTEDSFLIIKGSVYTCDEVGNAPNIPKMMSRLCGVVHPPLMEFWVCSKRLVCGCSWNFFLLAWALVAAAAE